MILEDSVNALAESFQDASTDTNTTKFAALLSRVRQFFFFVDNVDFEILFFGTVVRPLVVYRDCAPCEPVFWNQPRQRGRLKVYQRVQLQRSMPEEVAAKAVVRPRHRLNLKISPRWSTGRDLLWPISTLASSQQMLSVKFYFGQV